MSATLTWFARHETRLAWRDMLAMMTAGRPGRERKVAFWLIAFALLMHGIAWLVLRPYISRGIQADLPTLIVVTASVLLSASAMLSQAMESVTRTFYSRADLDLILSAPVNAWRLFAVRIGAMALSAGLMSVLLMGPFIDILALRGGARWLSAYGLLAAVSLVTTGLALILTIALFRTIGPKRTRLAAQIAAALIGGIFVIGLQIAALFSNSTLSRLSVLQSPAVLRHAPAPDSLLWWPARAALGDASALAWVLGISLLFFCAIARLAAPRFAGYVLSAAGVSHKARRRQVPAAPFRVRLPAAALRHKERVLIARDPWLLSQSLMQLLYLSPPALLLWQSFGHASVAVVLVPVLAMSAGQLAGGLAWLTISGEDAPDLVGSAPVSQARLLRAKVEAVMQAIAIVFTPFVTALAMVSLAAAAIAVAAIVAAALSSILIQLWFRSQAKRSQFRRRHTSSRIATLAEAFLSITWAAVGGIAAAGSPLAAIAAAIAGLILLGVWRLSPARQG